MIPAFYVGQIWTNADKSVFRQILGVSSKKTPALRVRFTDAKPDDKQRPSEWVSVDEFLWWAAMNEAQPILSYFQD